MLCEHAGSRVKISPHRRNTRLHLATHKSGNVLGDLEHLSPVGFVGAQE
jgi:hypothetical protein